MANALDAVLELKARESADRRAQSESIMNAMQLFQNARQQQFQRQLASIGLEREQRQMEAEGQRESQRIENERLRQAQEKRKQDIELARYGLRDTGVGISEDPNSMYQRNILSEINARKANETIAALMKGQQIEQIGINMQKDAFDLEDDSAYARGKQIRQMGQNISANAVIPEDQKLNSYLGKAGNLMPYSLIPVQDNTVPSSGKTIAQMKEERRKKEFEQKISEKVEETKQIELAKGIPADKAGSATLAQESITNVDNTIKSLFPKGTPESFDRKSALYSNFPNLKLPGNIQIGPSFIPTEKGQDIYRWTGNALAGRQLIQTGVAARPDETRGLVGRFAANAISNPESTLKGFNELREFYVKFFDTLSTKGIEETKKQYPGAEEFLKTLSSDGVSKYKEGQRARNPKTNEEIIFRGGKWQKI